MNLPTIDGRECVPVRLLLFLTAWRPLSPDVVAELFSHPDGRRSWDLVSFQLSSGKEPAPWYPRDWDHIHDDLTTLSISLKRSEAFEFEHEREWRRRSVELLPAAVFVWRDELVAHYALKFGGTAFTNTLPSRMELDAAHLRIARLMEDPTASDGADDADTTFLGEVECDEDTERVDDDFRNGDGQLNFARNLPVADTPVVFEGFGSVMLGIQRLARPSDAQAEHEPAIPVALAAPQALLVTTSSWSAGIVKHSIKTKTHALSAVIEKARRLATDAQDHQSVWAELVRLAQSSDRPAPIIGYVEVEGVQYGVAHSEEPMYFTKKALKEQFARAKAR